jgi:hypothetical protein
MANSTHVSTETHTLVTTTFTAASQTKTKATDDVDLTGEATAASVAISDAKRGLQLIVANLDPADTQLVLANNILATLT